MKRAERTRFVPIALWGCSLLGAIVTVLGALASYGPGARLQAAVQIHCVGFVSILAGVAFLRRTRHPWKWLHAPFVGLAAIGMAYNAWQRTPWQAGAVLAIVFVALAWAARRLWWGPFRAHPSNHCRACGYDLTGNVSGRCPECGVAVSS
jgi:drug/metabolite transporter (DMT)-like permease